MTRATGPATGRTISTLTTIIAMARILSVVRWEERGREEKEAREGGERGENQGRCKEEKRGSVGGECRYEVNEYQQNTLS